MTDRSESVLRATLSLVIGGAASLALVTLPEDQPTRYGAIAQAVVRPVTGGTGEPDSSFFQTLARGGVIESHAEIVRRRAAEVAAGGPADVTVSIKEDTSVVQVVARRPTRADATRTAGVVIEDAATFVERLGQPYELKVIEPGASLPGRTGGEGPLKVAAGAGGVCAAALAYRVLRLFRRDSNHTAPAAKSTE